MELWVWGIIGLIAVSIIGIVGALLASLLAELSTKASYDDHEYIKDWTK